MKNERTLSIIKPNGIQKNLIGAICWRFEKAELSIIGSKMKKISEEEAKIFYSEHKSRVFFHDLIKFIISGPVMIQVLEGKNAIKKNRLLMGATDPKQAESGTIRGDFGESIEKNIVHGSDSPQSAAFEINLFFKKSEIFDI